jgi:hypothetical protein
VRGVVAIVYGYIDYEIGACDREAAEISLGYGRIAAKMADRLNEMIGTQ